MYQESRDWFIQDSGAATSACYVIVSHLFTESPPSYSVSKGWFAIYKALNMLKQNCDVHTCTYFRVQHNNCSTCTCTRTPDASFLHMYGCAIYNDDLKRVHSHCVSRWRTQPVNAVALRHNGGVLSLNMDISRLSADVCEWVGGSVSAYSISDKHRAE